MIVRVVDICGIVHHHCLNVLSNVNIDIGVGL